MATVWKALVRNDVSVVPWSKGETAATRVGRLNVAPPSMDRVMKMPSLWRSPALKRRQVIQM